jgi:hypothetical protein
VKSQPRAYTCADGIEGEITRILQVKSAHTVRSSPTPLGARRRRVDRAPYRRRATSHPAPGEVEAGESQR